MCSTSNIVNRDNLKWQLLHNTGIVREGLWRESVEAEY